MTVIEVDKAGILPGTQPCNEALEALIAANPADTEFVFPAGDYYLEREVRVTGAKRVTLTGRGARLLTHFSACGDPRVENNNAFRFEDCWELCVNNFAVSTDHPVNNAGRIIAVDPEQHTYDVQIDPAFPMTGWEHLYGSDTCSEEGIPDHVLDTYDKITRETVTDENGQERLKIVGVNYTVLPDNVIRVKLDPNIPMERLRIGHRILFRYEIYGHSVFDFFGCHDVTLRDIEIERCTSMGATIHPYSTNFTFERFCIRSPKDSPALYAANADGIHALGLGGYLHLKDCTFIGLGDDALNVHGTAADIRELSEDGREMVCGMIRDRRLPDKWAAAGDTLTVYDHETFLEKGTVTLASFENARAVIASHTGEYAPGDILANQAFFPSVHLENCEVRNTRARGFLLQSHHMLVENCRVIGVSLPGIIVSPDIRYWYEVGPSRDVEIRDCVFEKCSYIIHAANLGAIVVKASHDAGSDAYPAGVHKDMRILRNTFRDCGSSGVYVSATQGLTVSDNTVVNGSCCRVGHIPSTAFAVALRNCNEVTVQGNRLDRGTDTLLYAENCIGLSGGDAVYARS